VFFIFEILQDRFFLFGFHPPVHQSQGELGKNFLLQAFKFGGDRLETFESLGFRFFDQGADNENLRPMFFDLLSDPVVGGGSFLRWYDPGLDDLPPAGHLVEIGEIEVAVKCQGQTARNRGGRHRQKMQKMGGGSSRRFFQELGALFNPEAVLFVDHDQAEIGEFLPIMEQGMCAYQDIDFSMVFNTAG